MEYTLPVFSVYSLFTALLIFSVIVLVMCIATMKATRVSDVTLNVLSLLGILAIIRLLVPLDLKWAFVIESTEVLPYIKDLLRYNVFGSFSVRDILFTIWYIGIALAAIIRIVQSIIAHRYLKSIPCILGARTRSVAEELDCRYKIVRSPGIREPFTAGVFRPVIYLPTVDFTDEELKVVLEHEARHIKSRDNLKKLILLAIEVVFWWNPVSYIIRRTFDQVLELRCDAAAVKGKSDAERAEYASLLLLALCKLEKRKRNHILCSHLNSSGAGVFQRVKSLLANGRVSGRKTAFISYTIICMLFLASYFVIIQPRYLVPPMDDVVDAMEMEDTDTEIREINGKYYLFIDGIMKYEITNESIINTLN